MNARWPSLAAVLALIMLNGCLTPSQTTVDIQVKELCAKDGGIKVYEKVVLPATMFDEYGNVNVPEKSKASSNDQYYREWIIDYYKRGNPELWRSEHRIVRASDKKVLGVLVRYSWRGGDAPSPIHDSSFSCPAIGSQPSLEKFVFIRGT